MADTEKQSDGFGPGWEAYCQEVADHNRAWTEKWPRHCAVCRGWGGRTFYESHGFRGGGSEQAFDPCDCMTNGKCPRCGEIGLIPDEAAGPCKRCGWNFDDGMREP